MTIEALQKEGYRLRSWSICTLRGERKITLHLTKKSGNRDYEYVAAATVGNTTLGKTEFTIPILRA